MAVDPAINEAVALAELYRDQAATSSQLAEAAKDDANAYTGEAATNASLALTRANLALAAQQAAEASESAVNAIFATVQDVYLGSSATALTQRPDASALQVGDIYWDTNTSQLLFWDSVAWVTPDAAATTAAVNASASAASATSSAASAALSAATATVDADTAVQKAGEASADAAAALTYRNQAAGYITSVTTFYDMAETSANNSYTYSVASQNFSDLAYKWAEEDPYTEVNPGEYSARHYAYLASQTVAGVDTTIGNFTDAYSDDLGAVNAAINTANITIGGNKAIYDAYVTTNDAAVSTVKNRLDAYDLLNLDGRTTSVEDTLDILNVNSVIQTVVDFPAVKDDLEEGREYTLSQLMEIYKAKKNARLELAFAQQSLATDINDARKAAAQYRLDLAAAIDANSAQITQLNYVSADSKSALARMVAAMQVKAYGNEAAILNESLLRADEFGVLARTIEAQLTAFGLQQEDNYDPTRTYYEGQGVVYLGIGYLATESVVGENPDTSAKWIPITDLNLANWIADTYDIDQQYLQGLIDGKIDTYYGSDDPSTDWTVEEKVENTGDFWFVEQLNAQTGETTRSLFRYDGASWQVINDDAAITAAALAQQTADGKVSTYIGSTADRNDLTGMSNGDIFIVNDVDGEGNPTNVYWIYVESALEWQEVTDGRVPAATADILDIKQNQIGYCTDTNGNIFDAGGLITNKTTMDDWVTANPGADELPLTWNEGLPFGKIFEAIKINTTANTGSIEQLFEIYETAIGDIEGEITFKLDINGRVGGFGYSGSSANQGTLFSVVADKFTVAAPADFTVDSTSPPASPTDGDVWYQPDTGVTQRYNGSDWAAFDPTPPFTVLTTEQTYEGRTVPAGVYISKAAIGQLDANQINVSQLAAESIFVSKYREAAINASSPNLAIGSTTGANWTGSFTASSYTHSKENSSTTVAEFLLSDYLDALTAGSEYTLSFLGRKDSNVTGLNIHVLSDTGGVTVLNLANLTTEVTTSYKYFAYTFTVPNDLAGLTDVRIRFTNPSVTSGTGKIFVRNVQLELGPYDTLFRIPAADTVTAIVSAATTADWASVDSRPTTLSELNTTDGSKLAGIPADADKTDYTDSRIANSEVTLDGLGGEASGTAASLVDAIVIPTENLVDTSMLEGVGASGIYGGYNYTRSKSVPSNTNWRIQGWTKNLSDSPTAAQVHGDYVVSFWIKTDSATATDITFDLCDTGNFTVSATSTWQYVSKVFTNVTSVHLTSIYYGFFDIYSAAARTITIANMFIGYGNQIVDWKPSVKDASSPGFYKITSWADIATVPTAENFRAAFGKYPIDRDVLLLEDTSTPVKQKIYVYEASSSTFSEQVGYFAGDVLVEGTVTADKIAANAITADRLSVGVNADIDKGTTALQIGDISEIISEGNLPTGETTYTVSGDKTITFSGNNVTSSGGTDNSWSGSFYSDIGYSSACAISFKIGSANFGLIRYMIGLNTDPTTNNSYGSIDYQWYINTTSATLYTSGSNVVPENGGSFSLAIGDTLSLVYDGISKIYCYHNATLKHTFTGVSASKFYLDSSFYDNITTEVDDVRFAPIQNIDYGSIGGVTIAPNKLYHGAGNFNSSDTGFYLDSTGQFSLKNNLSFDGTDLTVQGKVNAADFVVTGNTTGVSANTVKEGGVTAASLSTDAIEFIDNRILNFIGATASTTYPAVDLLTNYSAPFGAMGSGVAEYLTLGLGTAIAATHGIQDIELSASVQLNWSHTGYSGTGNLTITLQRADNSSFTTNLVDIKSSVAPISFYYFNGYLYYTEAAVTAQIAANALTTGQDYYYRLKVVSDVNVQSNSSGDCYISLYEAAGVESTGGDAATYGSLTITGDLTVNGTTTTLNTATLDVEDKNITLNYGTGDTSASADGAGITIQDAVNSTTNATLLWDATNDRWELSHGLSMKSNNINTINTLHFDNTEGSSHGTVSGMLMFDENFYDDTEYGSTTLWNGNGGGLVICNEDGWGRVITDRNMEWLNADFNGLTVGGTSVTLDGDCLPLSGGTLTETLRVNSANYALVDEGSLGWSYMPTEDGVNTSERYFLKFDYTNDGSFPYLTNRTTNGKWEFHTNDGAAGGETLRMRLNGGSGNQRVEFHNSTIAIGTTDVIDTNGTFIGGAVDTNQVYVDSNDTGFVRIGGIANTSANGYIRESITFTRDKDQITWDGGTQEWVHSGGTSSSWSMLAHLNTGMYFYSGDAEAVETRKDNATFISDHLAMYIDTASKVSIEKGLTVTADITVGNSYGLVSSNGAKIQTGTGGGTWQVSGTSTANCFAVLDSTRATTHFEVLNNGDTAVYKNLRVANSAPRLVLSDTNNSYGGGSSHGIEFETTGGNVAYIGSANESDNSLIITNDGDNANVATESTSYGGDIILHPISNVNIKDAALEMGGTAVINSNRDITANTITLNNDLIFVDTDFAYSTSISTLNNGGLSISLDNGDVIADTDFRIRLDRSSGASQFVLDADGDITLEGGISLGGNIIRTDHNAGFLVGAYDSLGNNKANVNPIYAIGTSYLPTNSTTSGAFYGIGYSKADSVDGYQELNDLAGADGDWGLHVSAGASPKVFLGGATGNIYGTGSVNVSSVVVNGSTLANSDGDIFLGSDTTTYTTEVSENVVSNPSVLVNGGIVWGAIEQKSHAPSYSTTVLGTNSTAYPDVYGESDLSAIDDYATFTWEAAKAACESHGGRLPTLEEIVSGCGEGSGQGYDSEFLWTSTEAGPDKAWVAYGKTATYGGPKIVSKTDLYRTRCFFDASLANKPVYYNTSGNITTQNSVGIGTSSPSAKLEIDGSASTDGILVTNPLSGSFYNAKLEFRRDTTLGGAKIQTERNAAGGVGLSFNYTANNTAEVNGTYSEAMRIDSSGNLLVGKTVVTNGVEGSVFWADGLGDHTRDSDFCMRLNRLTSDGEILSFRKDGTTVGSIAVASGFPYIYNGTNDDGIYFGNNAFTPCNTSGAIKDNIIDVGSSAARWKDLHLSGVMNSGSISTGNITSTGNIDAEGYIEAGESTGGVALTVNDGDGNANLCFNHNAGVPRVTGSACRVKTDVDGTTAGMQFLLKDSVTANTDYSWATFTMALDLSTARAQMFGNFQVNSAGAVIAEGDITAFGSVSDIRKKENVEQLTDAVSKVKQLRGITFNYIGKDESMTGVVAQEVQKVLPQAVYDHTDIDGNDMLAVRHGNMVGLLIEAIKEQQSEIDELKSLVKQLLEK